METGLDSLTLHTALSMSLLADEGRLSGDAETARLVRQTLGGDNAAFEQIIARYETRVMSMAARLLGGRDDARDVAQEVFLRAFKYLHRLDVQKPVEPWLFRIAVNVCRDTARLQRQRRNTFVAAEETETIDTSIDTHADAVRNQQRRILQRAIDLLPEKERLAIVLRDLEGLSTTDVAAILQSSESTVRSQVSRARLRLKEAVERMMGNGR